MSEMRRVTAICNGTVVDHIPAGKALQVMQMLRVDTRIYFIDSRKRVHDNHPRFSYSQVIRSHFLQLTSWLHLC